jgi:hypothetical protein
MGPRVVEQNSKFKVHVISEKAHIHSLEFRLFGESDEHEIGETITTSTKNSRNVLELTFDVSDQL